MKRALVLAVLLFANVAGADDVEAARAAFEKGAALAEESRWSDALAQFEASAKLRPHGQTFFNIGYCERALGHATRARKYFALALARGAELTDQLRASSESYLTELRPLVAAPVLHVSPSSSTITIDGRPLERDGDRLLAGTRAPGPGEAVPAATFVVEIDAGPHEIVVVAPDGSSKIAHADFPAGSHAEVTISVPPKKKETPIVVAPSEPSVRRPIGIALSATGLVAVGVGAYFAFSASSTWSDAKNACPARTACPTEDGARLSASAQRQANVATWAIVGGSAAIVSGVVLVLTAPRAAVSAAPLQNGAMVGLATEF